MHLPTWHISVRFKTTFDLLLTMIIPIHVFGSPALRVEADPVTEDGVDFQKLVDDMIETMHGASGIGLASPQVGRTERLFVVDLSPVTRDEESQAGGPDVMWEEPVVFVNPEILEVSEEMSEYEEGCLSIPEVTEVVERPVAIRIKYLDRELQEQETELSGMPARVVQHEYDHLNGVLFTDRISPLRRRLLKRRLRDMAKGEVEADYPLVAPVKAARR